MSDPTFHAGLFDDLSLVHRDSRDAVDPSLHLYWEINDGLIYWLGTFDYSDAMNEETRGNFAALSVWLVRLLYANRMEPFATKGSLKILDALESAVHPIINSNAASEGVRTELIAAKLGLISLAPGFENVAVATLADDLECLIEGVTEDIGVRFPPALLPSLWSIAQFLEQQIREAQPETNEAPPRPVHDTELEMF